MAAICQANKDHPGNKAPFAVKGGGHMALPGSNITPGALIDLKRLYQIEPDYKLKTIDVGPGLTWDDVYAVLHRKGWSVNGATTCTGVGVAGFLLGGGFSNRTSAYGLAMDNINSLDVVLPDGTIKEGVCLDHDSEEKSDLFWALRGGGNNFGIVTKWCIPIHPVEPNLYSYTAKIAPEQYPALIDAIVDFVEKDPDPLANIEIVFLHRKDKDTGKFVTEASMELFYEKTDPPPQLFDALTLVPKKRKSEHVSRTWAERQKYHPINSLPLANSPPGHKISIPAKANSPPGQTNDEDTAIDDEDTVTRGRFSSVMVSTYTKELIQTALDAIDEASKLMKKKGGHLIYADIWPFSKDMYKHSQASAWPHKPGEPSGPLVINYVWTGETNNLHWLGSIKDVTTKIRDCALKNQLTTTTTPAYYNLSLDDVTVEEIYQENLPKLKKLRKQFDPNDVMSSTGGFRIPFP